MDETREDNTGTKEPHNDNAVVNVVEKKDWVEEAIKREATPKSLREPKTDQEFIKQYGVAESTFYYTLAKDENQRKIMDLCFKQAKKRLPEVLEKLGEKAERGNDTSIGQFMEYVAEVKKRIELSGDKDNPIEHRIEEIKYIIPNENSNNSTNTKTTSSV